MGLGIRPSIGDSLIAGRKAARDAILLSQFSIEYLPLFVGLSVVLALPVIIVAGKLMTRHGPHRLVPVGWGRATRMGFSSELARDPPDPVVAGGHAPPRDQTLSPC